MNEMSTFVEDGMDGEIAFDYYSDEDEKEEEIDDLVSLSISQLIPKKQHA